MFLKLGEAEYHLPDWYVEGAASWTMTVLGNGTTIESSFWLTYLNTPTWSLFQRTYSALGFFAHLAETGTDVWHKILPMGQAIVRGWNAAGWQAAAPGQAFLDSWGPGSARLPCFFNLNTICGERMNERRPTLVLVHGAWHGSWIWAEMTGRPEAAGIATRTIDGFSPSC
jgi:hypothetical protein